MIEVPKDLGRRIVEATRLAVELHIRAMQETIETAEGQVGIGRRVVAGGAGQGLVTDDEPTGAGLSGRATPSRRSSWTSAGEHPAGSFFGADSIAADSRDAVHRGGARRTGANRAATSDLASAEGEAA